MRRNKDKQKSHQINHSHQNLTHFHCYQELSILIMHMRYPYKKPGPSLWALFPFPLSVRVSLLPPMSLSSEINCMAWSLQHTLVQTCLGTLPPNLKKPGLDFLSAVFSLFRCFLVVSMIFLDADSVLLRLQTFSAIRPMTTQQHAFSCSIYSPQLVCLSACQTLSCNVTHGFSWDTCQFVLFH